MESKWYWKIWEEGDYFDAWTIAHVLSGIWAAGLSLFLNLNYWTGFLICFLLMTAWEIFETWRKIHEWLSNKIMDVATGMIGFAVFYNLQERMSIISEINFFSIGFIIYLFFVLWGYKAYLRRVGDGTV